MGSASSVVAKCGTATKLSVGDDDTRVDNVSVGALSSGCVVAVCGGRTRLAADSSKTPGCASLTGQSLLLNILMDLLDIVVEVGDCVRLDKGNLDVLSVYTGLK